MARRLVRALVWTGSLAGLLVLLRLAAADELSTPPLRSLDDLGAWADDRGPVSSALGLVRFAAELAVWYLLGLSLLHGASVARRTGGARTWVDRLAPGAANRLVRAGLGVGLLATSTVQGTAVAVAGAPPGTAVAQPAAEGPRGSARMVPRPAPANPPPPPETPPPPTQHRVEPGESFWTIAADVLEQHWGREPTDAELDPFWRALVDANRHRLVGDDPDHILPGQVFEVPPPPPSPPA